MINKALQIITYKAVLFNDSNWISYDGTKNITKQYKIKHSIGSYDLFETSRLSKGKNKGEITFKLLSFDYTKEHPNRKVEYKLVSGKNKVGHISKVFPIGEEKAHGDIKGTNDKLFITWNSDKTEMLIHVLPGLKHEYALIESFINGELGI